MTETKEVCTVEDTVLSNIKRTQEECQTLFGKYQIQRVLGVGRAGTVFLVRHMELDELRAVKRVPKTFEDYGRFKQEALILKELRHPGIPIIYDLEEDSQYSYLIEEYLEGESFYDLIHNQGHLTEAMTISYGIQICRLVNYLHSAGKIPILHLDLQPKNLLLCRERVKLIDFDHSATITQANAASKRFGTIGCAAPEQYCLEERLDERTDIYAIGVALTYLGTGRYPDDCPLYGLCGWNRRFRSVVEKCLNPNPDKRYQTAEDLCRDMERLEKRRSGVFSYFRKNQPSSLTIALAGSRSGVGTTHLALGLSAYLRTCHFPVLYEEKNDSGTAFRIGTAFGAGTDQYGFMTIKGCAVRPNYGENAVFKPYSYPFLVQDYGTDIEALKTCADADWILLVCDGSPWEWETSLKAAGALEAGMCADRGGILAIFNHTKNMRIKESRYFNKKNCFKMPWQPDPFSADAGVRAFYQAVSQRMGLVKKDRRFL